MDTPRAGNWHAPTRAGAVRLAPIAPLPAILREYGVAPRPLLAAHGLDEAAFADHDRPLAFVTIGALLVAAARATACPHLGILLGQRADASTLGAVGFLMASAPDVRTALAALVANLDLHDRGAAPYLEVSGKTAMLGYSIHLPDITGSEIMYDTALAVGWNLLRGLCGSNWLPLEVRFRHPHPENIEPYRRFFQARLVFEAEHNAVVFSSDWLDAATRLADPLLHSHFRQHVEAMRRYTEEDLVERVRKALVRLLETRRCSLAALADEFAMHPRTLNRRLKEAGTSFRELQQGARHMLACQLLRDTRSTVPTIASLLGYSGPTAFTRAFVQWEGEPPAAWRKRIRAAELIRNGKE
jgi:AraC-like DNA-binding protein